MEKTRAAEQLLSKRFREEIDKIHICNHCFSSAYMGGVTIPSADGNNRAIFCLNHKPAGIILSRFQYDPIPEEPALRYANMNY